VNKGKGGRSLVGSRALPEDDQFRQLITTYRFRQRCGKHL
jgi:hypothetical protein